MKRITIDAKTIRGVLIVLVILAALYNFFDLSRQKKEQQIVPAAAAPAGETTEAAEPVKDVKKWYIFRDETENIQLHYPSHWEIRDHSAKDQLIRADLSDGKQAGLQVRVQKNVQTDLESFAQSYLEQFIADMKNHWKGDIGVIEQRVEQIGKHRGFRALLVLNRGDGQKWLLKEFIWKRDEKVVIFQAGARSGVIHIYEPLFDKIAGSFTFLD
jgi:hypothetical protein